MPTSSWWRISISSCARSRSSWRSSSGSSGRAGNLRARSRQAQTARRRSVCRRTCSAQCSNTLPRSRREGHGGAGASGGAGCLPAPEGTRRLCARREQRARRRAYDREGSRAGVKRRDDGASLVEIPGVPRRQWDRAACRLAWMLRSRCTWARSQLRRAAEHARRTRRSSKDQGCFSGCSGGRSPAGTGQVRAAARPPGSAAVRDVRVADGDQLRSGGSPLQ